MSEHTQKNNIQEQKAETSANEIKNISEIQAEEELDYTEEEVIEEIEEEANKEAAESEQNNKAQDKEVQDKEAQEDNSEEKLEENLPIEPPKPSIFKVFYFRCLYVVRWILWRISYITRSEHFLTSALLAFVGIAGITFFIWASNVSIEKTVKAQGVVMAVTENQIISHLEGGVVKSISVVQGEEVVEGQPLVEIVNMDMRRDKERYLVQERYINALLRRLYAERDGVDFSITQEELNKNTDLAQQYKIFIQNKETLQNTIDILETQRDKFIADKEAKLTQHSNLHKEWEIAQEQVSILEPLVTEGIGSRQNYLQRQAETAKLKTALDDLAHSAQSLNINIDEATEKIIEEKSAFLKKVEEDIATNSNELNTIRAELNAIDLSIERSTLRAPISGTVHRMHTTTIGGVVRAGDPLIEIVPQATSIRVEAKVQPQDRTNIHFNQEAKVRPTSYSFSLDTMLLVDITSISAQTFLDEQSRTYYYKVFLQSKTPSLTEKDKKLYASFLPGMIVEVNILAGEESLLHYLFTPIIRGLDNALTERSTR